MNTVFPCRAFYTAWRGVGRRGVALDLAKIMFCLALFSTLSDGAWAQGASPVTAFVVSRPFVQGGSIEMEALCQKVDAVDDEWISPEVASRCSGLGDGSLFAGGVAQQSQTTPAAPAPVQPPAKKTKKKSSSDLAQAVVLGAVGILLLVVLILVF